MSKDKPGRVLRRARNTIKRYAGKSEPKLVARFNRAQGIILAHALSKRDS
jgi:hypothetical protein